MVGAVGNEDRVTTTVAMYDDEASAEDYGDRVEDSTKTTTTTVVTTAATTSDDGSNDDNGSNDNDEMTTPMSTALERAAQRWRGGRGRRRTLRLFIFNLKKYLILICNLYSASSPSPVPK